MTTSEMLILSSRLPEEMHIAPPLCSPVHPLIVPPEISKDMQKSSSLAASIAPPYPPKPNNPDALKQSLIIPPVIFMVAGPPDISPGGFTGWAAMAAPFPPLHDSITPPLMLNFAESVTRIAPGVKPSFTQPVIVPPYILKTALSDRFMQPGWPLASDGPRVTLSYIFKVAPSSTPMIMFVSDSEYMVSVSV